MPVDPPNLLVSPEAIDPFDRGNGVTTYPYVGKWNSPETTVTTGITAFRPDTGLPLHSHNVEESVLVLEGEATAQIGEQHVGLSAGSATWVPAGVPHRFLNRGRSLLQIYWVYAGREITRTITATGETFAHLSEHDKGGLPADP